MASHLVCLSKAKICCDDHKKFPLPDSVQSWAKPDFLGPSQGLSNQISNPLIALSDALPETPHGSLCHAFLFVHFKQRVGNPTCLTTGMLLVTFVWTYQELTIV